MRVQNPQKQELQHQQNQINLNKDFKSLVKQNNTLAQDEKFDVYSINSSQLYN